MVKIPYNPEGPARDIMQDVERAARRLVAGLRLVRRGTLPYSAIRVSECSDKGCALLRQMFENQGYKVREEDGLLKIFM